MLLAPCCARFWSTKLYDGVCVGTAAFFKRTRSFAVVSTCYGVLKL